MSEKNTDTCELRCACGNLLARRTAEGLEIKCRRCKRIMVLPLPPAGSERWVEVTVR